MMFVTQSQKDYIDAATGTESKREFMESETANRFRALGADPEIAYDLDLPPPVDGDEDTDLEDAFMDPGNEDGKVFNFLSKIGHDYSYGVGDYEKKGQERLEKNRELLPVAKESMQSSMEEAANRSPRDIAAYGLDDTGNRIYNFTKAGIDFTQIDDMPAEVGMAQAGLMEMYDRLPNGTWKGTKRFARSVIKDPVNFIGGVANFKLVRQLLSKGGTKAVRDHIMERAAKAAGYTIIGSEGSAYAAMAEYMNQKLSHDPEQGELQPDWPQIFAMGGFGAVAAAGGTAAIRAVPDAVRAGRNVIRDAAGDVNTLRSGVGPTASAQNKQLDIFDMPGAAPDRSDFSLVRFQAPKGASARVQDLGKRLTSNPKVADEFRALARDGEEVGRNWYNTEELRDKFIDYLGEEKGNEAWKDYIWLVGATSTGSKVKPNIRNASYYYSIGREELQAVAEELLAGEKTPPKGSGYGHKMQKNQAMNVGRFVTGQFGADIDPRQNPKPRGFAQSLLGNQRNIAADKHFMRMLGMMSQDPRFLHGSAEVSKELVAELRVKFGNDIDKYIKTRDVGGKPVFSFNAKKAVREGPDGLYDAIKNKPSIWEDMPNDNEYDFLEKFSGELGRELNMTAPQFQAALWMGAAKKTGVDPTSQYTFMEIFNDLVQTKAKARGLTVDEVLRRFVTGEQPLLAPLAAGAAAAGTAADTENNNDSSPDT